MGQTAKFKCDWPLTLAAHDLSARMILMMNSQASWRQVREGDHLTNIFIPSYSQQPSGSSTTTCFWNSQYFLSTLSAEKTPKMFGNTKLLQKFGFPAFSSHCCLVLVRRYAKDKSLCPKQSNTCCCGGWAGIRL